MEICAYEEFIALQNINVIKVSKKIINHAVTDIPCRTAFALYMVLLNLIDDSESKNHAVIISNKEISELLDVSYSTTIRSLNILKSKGYIQSVQRGGIGQKYAKNKLKIRFPRRMTQRILYENLT